MKVYVPVLERAKSDKGVQTRLDQFEGRSIAFLDNMKAGAQVFLDECRRLLEKRHPGMRYEVLQKPSMSEGAPEDTVRQAIKSHAVITGFGDWGSCTSWSVHDTIELEKNGIPALILVSEKFQTLATMEADALDMPNIRMVILPHPIGTLSDDELRGLAQQKIEQIEGLLLQEQE